MKQLEKVVWSAQFSSKSATTTGRKQRRADGLLVITTSGENATRCRPESGR
jgi:hypothetical protein